MEEKKEKALDRAVKMCYNKNAKTDKTVAAHPISSYSYQELPLHQTISEPFCANRRFTFFFYLASYCNHQWTF